MKFTGKLNAILIAAFGLFIAGTILGQSSVAIESGYGGQNTRSQKIVDIWAKPAESGFVFDQWTGDTHLLSDRHDWHARLKTGPKEISLSATYKPSADWQPTAPEAICTSTMRYFLPSNPVGIVFHFHGSGGSLNGLFNNTEQLEYARSLVAEGFGVVTINSSDRVNRQWDSRLPPDNPDYDNVQAAITTLISRGSINKSTPIFASGISNGGGFAPRVSYVLSLDGTVIFIATSNSQLMSLTNTPTMWNIMQNDSVLDPGSIARARSSFDTLKNRGIPAEFHLLRPTAVYRERFSRVPGLSENDSLVIWSALRTNGFLDAHGYLVENPRNSQWTSSIPNEYDAFLSGIRDQLWISYTEHKFFSNHNHRVVRFLNSLL